MSVRLLLLSGPSCVGKGPLLAALRRCHPELPFASPVVHTSRAPRPGELDGREFHFRDADAIRRYDPDRYFIYPMRNQMRAIDLTEIESLLASSLRVIVELHPPRVAEFRAHPRLLAATEGRSAAILLQPLSPAEVLALAAASGRTEAEVVTDYLLPKQVHRSLRMGKLLDAAELHDLQVRAAAAWSEMTVTAGFDQVVVNHDAEGHDHWLLTPPVGDAGATLETVARALRA